MNTLVMHLGGNVERAHTTAAVAIRFLGASVLVSSELEPRRVFGILLGAGVTDWLIAFDFAPWDTVTHFTHGLRDYDVDDIDELHVVTDRFHLRRATWIARVVLLGSGVRIVGHAHDDPRYAKTRDPLLRLVRDLLRAAWWRLTGHLIYDRSIRTARTDALARAEAEARDAGLLHADAVEGT